MKEETRCQAEPVSKLKKSYHSPRLTEYGSLRELTTSGFGHSPDFPDSAYTFFLQSEDRPEGS